MQRVFCHLLGVICLSLTLLGASVALEAAFNLGPEAYAQAAGSSGALGSIEQKVADIVTLITNVLTALTVVAVAFVGFKFIKGDPDAWSFALKALVGVVVIFGAATLVQWLSS